jgi:hypothetical protein
MSMPQFGPDLARDRIDRLIEEARAHSGRSRPHRQTKHPGILGRIKGRVRFLHFGPQVREPGHGVRLQRESGSRS